MSKISHYEDFISTNLLQHLNTTSCPVTGVPDLKEIGTGGGLETTESLTFLCQLYDLIKSRLNEVLSRRVKARQFIDERTQASYRLNQTLKIDYLDPLYTTILGQENGNGEIVVGPLNAFYCSSGGGNAVAEIPAFLQGPHVTLFGPPDSAKMSINAMNAIHRKIKGEPPIVGELLSQMKTSPMWGADDEDSKTPLRQDLIDAGVNLSECFEGTLSYTDPNTNKKYALEREKLALPLKRFPGLALPSLFLFYKNEPLPLHLYDFALHLYRNWRNPKALAYYVPKLESKEEAAYLHFMTVSAETLIQKRFPEYKLGSIRYMVVLENPRVIFQVNEIMDALHPYFVGASLGWHDYLASTARLFKNDGNYRIPVKADPDIVIKYIKASHELLAQVVGPRRGIKVGGMYGILPIDNDFQSESFQLTLKGFFKDVLTQMKRELDGFWVAHPDFVRLGLAIVEAWRLFKANDPSKLNLLVSSLFGKKDSDEILKFIQDPDVPSLDKASPLYPRSLIVADIKESTFIANNHPSEIRYNIFQSLQYLTDWLSGNGCVALPAELSGVAVRVMDDLATAERSRWEVWHELHHGRFSQEEFIKIVHEEMLFIRKDLSDNKKIVQVKWDERTEKWYPIALRILLQLMTSKTPVEFATELLFPFTLQEVRESKDPWNTVQNFNVQKFDLDPYIERLHEYFSSCGNLNFATRMAHGLCVDKAFAESIIKNFSLNDAKEAAQFHGDIGESKKTLDETAAKEQALVQQSGNDALKTELKRLSFNYKEKFGFKFLISAKDKSLTQILTELKARLNGSAADELNNAKNALWEITRKRLENHPHQVLTSQIEAILQKHKVNSASFSIALQQNRQHSYHYNSQSGTYFELASLSKTLGTCLALGYFQKNNISLDTSVNFVFANTNSKFRIQSIDSSHPEWADAVTLRNLMDHTALNLHYVNGVPLDQKMPLIHEFLEGNTQYGYEPVKVTGFPGSGFQYSGGGFLVLEHLLEALSKRSILDLSRPFFKDLHISELSFQQTNLSGIEYANGYLDNGVQVEAGRKMFPAFAAGAMGTSQGMLQFLIKLTNAYHSLDGEGPISHDTAVEMLFGKDRGSREFMGTDMGLGLFTIEAGANRYMVHQGANDGFRCLYLYCWKGADRGKGFVILVNADQNGVQAIAEVAQLILLHLKVKGVNFENFSQSFQEKGVLSEHLVNKGYQELLFNAFEPDLPEAINGIKTLDPLSKYNLVVGSKILSVSNQRFARAENLLSPYLPIWDPEAYERQGKVMDSWETVRHNSKESDFLIFQLPKPSNIKFLLISTAFHLGNQAPQARVFGQTANSTEWKEIIPKVKLEGHAMMHLLSNDSKSIFESIRVEIFPDGGLTRLALFNDTLPINEQTQFAPCNKPTSQPVTEKIIQAHKPLAPKYIASPEKIAANWKRLKTGDKVDIASSAYGGKIISASNEHYGPAAQVISPFPPIHMFDGFESARSRTPNHHEELIIELGRASKLEAVELDFTHFVNNNPRAVSVGGLAGQSWIEIAPITSVKSYAGNKILFSVNSNEFVSQIKINVYPDGGINRVRAWTKV